MDKTEQELSHREMFHRHLASISNVKEKNSLQTKTKFYDRCKEESLFAFNREEKELRQHLENLNKEKFQHHKEGSCLNNLDSNESSNKISMTTILTAHDVAIHLLNKEHPGQNQSKRRRNRNDNQGETAHSDEVKQKSWHQTNTTSSYKQEGKSGGLKLPDIKSDGSRRRRSIGDPQEVTHLMNRRSAWTEKPVPPKPQSKAKKVKSRQRCSKSKICKKKTSKIMSNDEVTIVVSEPQECTSGADIVESVLEKSTVKEKRLSSEYQIMKSERRGSLDPTPKKSNPHPRRHSIDEESLQHYYDVFAKNERLLKQEDAEYDNTGNGHVPLSSLRLSHRRKTLALESLLSQLPSFKDKRDLDAIDCLNCSYLRLSKQNIADLEEDCKKSGKEAGVHPHMTEDRVVEYYKTHD